MRSILVIFLVQHLMVDEASATVIYHIFAAACYLFPLLGAYISDRILGKYKTIIYLSIVYCIGHFILAIWETEAGLYFGLGLIALGAGGIKPCVSAHVGDQFYPSQGELLKKVFNLFYWMINFGGFFSTLITPWTLANYGQGVAFGIPGVLMALATFVFWLGRHHYVHVPPTPKDPNGLFPILFSGIKNRKHGITFWEAASARHPRKSVDAVKAVWGIAKIFFTISIFWALFEQHGSTWILQAKEMNLEFLGLDVLPSQIPALNPIMIMLLIPFHTKVLYPGLEKLGFSVTPLGKMTVGMFFAAISFVLVAIIQVNLDNGVQLNVAWQFFPYLFITMAEVLIAITGLEFAYTQAPRSMKSTIMSIWLLTEFFGNLLTAYVTEVNTFEGGHFFMFFATLMFAVALIFWWISKSYKMQNYMEERKEVIN